MLQHELLALQGISKGTALLVQLSLVNFMVYVLSEDMTKSIIQWEYFASKEIQHSKSITNIRQMRCAVIMDVTNNVVLTGFLKDTKIAVSELYDNKKVSYLKIYYREQKTHTFIH